MSEYTMCNATELIESIRRRTGVVVKRALPRERLIQILESGIVPPAEEWSDTMESRRHLQIFVEKNWDWISSQIPCTGEGRGKCTTYPCPEARHLDCFQASRRQDI